MKEASISLKRLRMASSIPCSAGNSGAVVAANSLQVENIELRSKSVRPSTSRGVALGIYTRPIDEITSNRDLSSPPMSVSDFKERIRELLN
jgi:hypothetical protein